MTLSGIDISSHQPTTPIIGSLAFVFVRATYGLNPDDKYAEHAQRVRQSGAVLGAYHFGRNGDGAAQARAFLRVIGSVELVALDYERDKDNPKMTPAQAAAFIRTVQSTGRKCGLYASQSGYPSFGQDWRWIAKWSSTPPPQPWAFWQYAVADTPGDGAGRLDRDKFNGTMTQLRVLAGVAHWQWKRAGDFYVFDVAADGRITGRHLEHTESTVQPCTAPRMYAWPGHGAKKLVRLLDGPRRGQYVHARWAQQV